MPEVFQSYQKAIVFLSERKADVSLDKEKLKREELYFLVHAVLSMKKTGGEALVVNPDSAAPVSAMSSLFDHVDVIGGEAVEKTSDFENVGYTDKRNNKADYALCLLDGIQKKPFENLKRIASRLGKGGNMLLRLRKADAGRAFKTLNGRGGLQASNSYLLVREPRGPLFLINDCSLRIRRFFLDSYMLDATDGAKKIIGRVNRMVPLANIVPERAFGEYRGVCFSANQGTSLMEQTLGERMPGFHAEGELVFLNSKGSATALVFSGEEPFCALKIAGNDKAQATLKEKKVVDYIEREGGSYFDDKLQKTVSLDRIGKTAIWTREYITGRTLSQETALGKLNAGDARGLLSSAGEFLSRLWRLPAQKESYEPSGLLFHQKQTGKNGLTGRFISRLERLAVSRPVINHNDLSPVNVIRQGKGFRVLDWEQARWGPPVYDWFFFAYNVYRLSSKGEQGENPLAFLLFDNDTATFTRSMTGRLYKSHGIEGEDFRAVLSEALLSLLYFHVFDMRDQKTPAAAASCLERALKAFA